MQRILIFLMLLALTGCHTLFDAHGGNANVRFYAAVSDYNAAKGFAVVYVELPSTSLETTEKILAVVERADATIAQTHRLIAAKSASAGVLEGVTGQLIRAQALLTALTMQTGARDYPLRGGDNYGSDTTLRERTNNERDRHTRFDSDRARHSNYERLVDNFRTGEIQEAF